MVYPLTTPTYRRFTVDALLTLLEPFYSTGAIGLLGWAAAVYYNLATNDSASLVGLARDRNLPLASALRIAYNIIRTTIKSSRFLKAYTAILAIKTLNNIGQRVFIDKAAPRKIVWKDQIVVATGGASGITGRTCEILKAKGAKIVTLDMARKTQHGKEDLHVQLDIRDSKKLMEAREKIEKEIGMCTIVIAGAGTGAPGPCLDDPNDYPLEREELPIDVNLKGLMSTVRAFGSYMVSDRVNGKGTGIAKNGWGGHIVLLGSMAGYCDMPLNIGYHAAKAGVSAVHTGIIADLDYWYNAKNVRASCFCLLKVETPMTDGTMADAESQFVTPTLTANEVAERIVDVVEKDKSRIVIMPKGAYVLSFLRFMPLWVGLAFFKVTGNQGAVAALVNADRNGGGFLADHVKANRR